MNSSSLLLVDGEARPKVMMSLAKWRALAGFTGDEDEARTREILTSTRTSSTRSARRARLRRR